MPTFKTIAFFHILVVIYPIDGGISAKPRMGIPGPDVIPPMASRPGRSGDNFQNLEFTKLHNGRRCGKQTPREEVEKKPSSSNSDVGRNKQSMHKGDRDFSVVYVLGKIPVTPLCRCRV